MNIEPFYNEFKKDFKKSNSYQEPEIKYFNYNWIKLLDITGIKYK